MVEENGIFVNYDKERGGIKRRKWKKNILKFNFREEDSSA
jgi:hypothetical protein